MSFEAEFLGVTAAAPRPTAARETRLLPYTHFEVLLDPVRRLALSTAVNIDGARLVDLGRGDDWHLDDRIPASEQTGPEVYARNDLDRGHLVRRRDPVWGEPAEARAANHDSFCYTNAAPQASGFNQSSELWLGLETLVLEYAQTWRTRLSVFTGPVLAADDPVYRGTGIPRRFWKIAAWSPDGSTLATSAYLLDQSALVDEVREGIAPLGGFRTFQLPVSEVGELTGLDVAALAAADVLASPGIRAEPWRELLDAEDVVRGLSTR
ncbi:MULTISPECIES: DNA/RNA non-specific endonuclease [unclassified Rathayibacter]|uniref:DNA/RNA non-specific endonuclease n=1 Tax=unclassified Rathayibacter TaxID=2609250 RepID=UPI00188A53E4|nr:MULTISPECIES: DNA/RNA non-specific endonuclease [unclassified Rathayibacter]MBF4462022.1 DNA/RNA non-specific endonuclease [Rathayibacter sp. VKM Ac-2879]MBF4503935.1 DNA/RNA non-specific endonuclease [Rathayibacter sp. VKM Ac-2878]